MSVDRNQPLIDCERIRELLPAYSIGALDPEEIRFVETGLLNCPELAEDVADYRQLAERLPFSAPPVEPGPALKQSILRMATANKKPPPPTVQWQPTVNRRGWLAVAAAILVVLLVGSNLLWLAENTRLRDENDDLAAAQVIDLPSADLTEFIATGGVTRVDFADAPIAGTPTGALSWVSIEPEESWIAWFVGNDLTPPPAGQTYQLWLQRADEPPLRVGQFTVDASGGTAFVFEITEPIGSFDTVQVTLEAEAEPTIPSDNVILSSDIDV